MRKRIIILGASSKIAEHCARLWGQDDLVQLILIGRDEKKLTAIATDLGIRCPKALINTVVASFMTPESIEGLADKIAQEGTMDLVLIAHGTLPSQLHGQENLSIAADTLFINGVSPALCAEAFVKKLEEQGHGVLAVISSVAGERGRKSNYIYGSAKGLLTRYVEGLQHRFAKSKVRVILIKPGPTLTPMTAHLQEQLVLADVHCVARDIVQGIKQQKLEIYTPAKWKFIMLFLRHLPATFFNKLNI